jgi:hypothetical protein
MPAQRFSTRERASLEIYGKPGTIIGDLRNLSASGACIEWSHEGVGIKQGDLVRMTVFLKALNRRHNLSAEVVWREGNRSGLTFINADQVLSKMSEKT